MTIDKKFYINTSGDGILADTTENDVLALVESLKNSSKLVIHLHGGLVSKSLALETAERLLPVYQNSGTHPVFMVWESSLLETVKNNLSEIGKEDIFKIIVKQVMKFVVGKLTDSAGGKAGGDLVLPNDMEVAIEFQKRNSNQEPYAEIKPLPTLQDLNDNELNQFKDILGMDLEFEQELLAVVQSATPANEQIDTSKGITSTPRKPSATLMSPEVIDELATNDAGGKGVLSIAKAIIKVGNILWRVIHRHKDGRDHGVYTTVVEEVLREFYIANVGTAIWGLMKKDTLDTFNNFGKQPLRGGWFLIQELGKLLKSDHQMEVSIVSHSAGSIYACHFLQHLYWARENAEHPLPKDFRLKNLIFMAPACTFSLFDEALKLHKQMALFEHFRIFALKDELEAGYWEVPLIYPRSLLYLISGLLEKNAFDMPLVGMERYYRETAIYNQAEIASVSEFLDSFNGNAEVWSKEDRGDGLASDASKHGDFDETVTMASIQYILKTG
jgi:hypothetical protein